MSDRPVTIYALCEPWYVPLEGGAFPPPEVVRYVGKTANLAARLTHHLGTYSDTHCARWIRRLRRNGGAPIMVVLEAANDENWQERECWWIARYRHLGARLTNITDGGEGGWLLLWRNPEWRGQISAAIARAKSLPEARARASAQTRARWTNPATRAHQVARIREATNAPEWREKASQGQRLRCTDPAERARRSDEVRARWVDPVYKARVSASLRRFFLDPDEHERRSRTMREVMARPEVQAKFQAAMHEVANRPEYREKQRVITLARYDDPNERAKTGAMTRRYFEEHPEARAKYGQQMSANIQAYHSKPENKAAFSEMLRQRWSDPEFKSRVVAQVAATKARKKAARLAALTDSADAP